MLSYQTLSSGPCPVVTV